MVCAFHDSNCNGFGDMWWTDKCTYFSSIDDSYNSQNLKKTIFSQYESYNKNY